MVTINLTVTVLTVLNVVKYLLQFNATAALRLYTVKFYRNFMNINSAGTERTVHVKICWEKPGFVYVCNSQKVSRCPEVCVKLC